MYYYRYFPYLRKNVLNNQKEFNFDNLHEGLTLKICINRTRFLSHFLYLNTVGFGRDQEQLKTFLKVIDNSPKNNRQNPPPPNLFDPHYTLAILII